MSNRQPTEESFLKDIEKHEMTVLRDDEVYRHLRFASTGPNSWNQWFEIVTWPGKLVYSGDMGTYVFARLEDMFKFFRTDWINDPKDGKIRINPSYWGEKLESVDRCGRKSGYRDFSSERLREHVEERIKDWINERYTGYDVSPEEDVNARTLFEEELRESIEDEVYSSFGNGEHYALQAVNDFQCKIDGHTYNFEETWEWDCEEYTYRFIWCCYALAWSIQQYDKRKSQIEVAA